LKAVVFAAGKGERLWPLTDTTPKPLLPVAGRPILERTLKGLVKAGVREIAIVTSHREERIKEFVGDGSKIGFSASFVHQERPKGTADALRTCKTWLDGESRFIVIYGDDYYSTGAIAKFVNTANRSNDTAVGAAESEDPSRFGRLEIQRGKIRAIREKVNSKAAAKVNAGLYLLSDSVFKIIDRVKVSERGEYELTDVLNRLIQSNVSVLALPLRKDDWQAITYPWDLLEANQRELRTITHSIGKGRVDKGATLTKPIIVGKGAVVKSGSHLEGPAIIGEDSTIGPNAYIRPFTSIGRDCKVGASSEVKASILMDGAKVPHLSYVGDSILGQGSSLGAGTITANLRFDDSKIVSEVKGQPIDSQRRKLGAILGDGVRTGINVSIFPGVKIGAGAWIWPGVAVNRDVAAGERVKQSTL
jgi:UDP-N-acetylglucosamine diphosphorylase/glucosamine-1-phosphate N-acetyltransferase